VNFLGVKSVQSVIIQACVTGTKPVPNVKNARNVIFSSVRIVKVIIVKYVPSV